MSPAALYVSPVPPQDNHRVLAAVPIKGPALAIGSPVTADDGSYQSLITSLQETREVDMHMVDRLLDGGARDHLILQCSGSPMSSLGRREPSAFTIFLRARRLVTSRV